MVVFTTVDDDDHPSDTQDANIESSPSTGEPSPLPRSSTTRSSVMGTLKSFFSRRSRSTRSRKNGNSGNKIGRSFTLSNISNIPSIFYRKRSVAPGEDIVVVQKRIAFFFRMVVPAEMHESRARDDAVSEAGTSVKNHASGSFTVDGGEDEVSPWFGNFDTDNTTHMVPCSAQSISLSEDAVAIE